MIATTQTHALRALAIAGLLTCNACTVGPDYVRPAFDMPPAYKEASSSHAPLPVPERWWEIYGDSELNALLEQFALQNQSLRAAEARARQARALTDMARAAQFPTVVVGGTNDLALVAKWEVDLWGRIRRDVEAKGALAQASAADLAAVRLSLQAQLAQTYFLLRVRDAEIRLLQDMAASYARSLQIARNQYAAGIIDQTGIVQAQTQFSAAQVQMHDVRIARSQLEHAVAVLLGRTPADFSFPIAPLAVKVPEVPPVLPTDLLERRPDIAAAERRMAAASAQIGVAKAGSYPSIELFAGVSINKGLVGGATAAAPLYNGGAPQASASKAVAAYDEAVANYRQTVLDGLREVEDNLASLKILDEAASAQDEAVNGAHESIRIINNQFQAGIVGYLSVAMAQAAMVDNERIALDILARRLVASTTLIKALGGGWQADPANPAAETQPSP